MNVRLAILVASLPCILGAQAAVEAALGAGRAAGSAAPARNTGKAVAGTLNRVSRSLQESENPKSAARSKTVVPKRATPAGPHVTSIPAGHPRSSTLDSEVAGSFEDPSGIQEGMDLAEVARRYGPPSLKLTPGPGEETLCYRKKGLSVDATVRDGKIAAVQKSGELNRALQLTTK